MKNLTEMTKSELTAQMEDWFPWLKDPLPYQPRMKDERERELQFGAGNDYFLWWIEQNRLDAMRRGE